MDIQSSKKQREAVHEATKAVVDKLAEQKAKENQEFNFNEIHQMGKKVFDLILKFILFRSF